MRVHTRLAEDAAKPRDRVSGQYAHTVDRKCVCGHRLGTHTAAKAGGERPCLAGELGEGPCSCRNFRPARVTESDDSSNPTLIEYGVRELFKGKSIPTVARLLVKKFNGQQNLFMGGHTLQLDVKKVEEALWDHLAKTAVAAMRHFKPGAEHMALGGTLAQFHQPDSLEKELRTRVARILGHDLTS